MNVTIRPSKCPERAQYCANLDRLITNALGDTHSCDMDMKLFSVIMQSLGHDRIDRTSPDGVANLVVRDISDDACNYIATTIIRHGHTHLAAAWSLARTYPILLDFQAKSDTIGSCSARIDHDCGYDIEMPRATYDALVALLNVPNDTTDERVGVFNAVNINTALNIHEKHPIVQPYAADLRYLISFLHMHNIPTLDVV